MKWFFFIITGIGILAFILLVMGMEANSRIDTLQTNIPTPTIYNAAQKAYDEGRVTPFEWPSGNSGTYNGDDCTYDCSGHEAGAEWAVENEITDPYDCGGNSDSFIEGCETQAEINASEW